MRILIIADDLTGALDSAVTLTGGGLRCVVARRPSDVAAALAERPDVLGVSTASREGGSAAARAAVAAALDAVGALPEILFKKVDSRLKGHVAEEVRVFANRAGRSRALVAPAIPAQGRIVVGGRLSGAGVAEPVEVAAAVAASGLALEVPDIRTDADFDEPLREALNAPRALLVGAAGLAAAVARHATRAAAVSPVRLSRPVLLAVGSRDPITLAQIDNLRSSGMATISEAPDGICGSSTGGGAELIRLASVEDRPLRPRAAGERFALGIAELVESRGVRTLLGCGGETADAVLGALGVGVLVVEGEVLPGVPASRMLVGDRRLQLVTKSGGFGGKDTLVSVVEAAAPVKGEA